MPTACSRMDLPIHDTTSSGRTVCTIRPQNEPQEVTQVRSGSLVLPNNAALAAVTGRLIMLHLSIPIPVPPFRIVLAIPVRID